jgi:hypothetical protein
MAAMSITSDEDWRGLREVGRLVRVTLEALEIFEAHVARSAPALT